MKIVFGIGNPGKEYARTRHNIGWRVLDAFAGRLGVEFRRRRFQGRTVEGEFSGQRLLLVKPETYVNLVGMSAREVLGYTGSRSADLLAVVDDVNLPCGRIRIRAEGSAGGHNGLRSLIEGIGEDFPRLRIGVGAPQGGGAELVEHVLGPFSASEEELIGPAVDRAVLAVEAWIAQGIERCMNDFNGA